MIIIDALKYINDRIGYLYFVLSGKRPWSYGYHAYKQRHLNEIISRGSFNCETLEPGYGFRIDERIIEYPWMLSRLPSGCGKLLDAGSALNFDFILSKKVINEKKLFISTLAPEKNCFWSREISYIFEDLRDSCFKNNYFDWIVSLSTIEHIGLDNTMLYTEDGTKKENAPSSYLSAIREFRRILKPGGVLYLSVPFGKYKNHGWFQVFDGGMIDKLVQTFSPQSMTEKYFRYDKDGWHVSSRERSRDATCFDIHQQKNYDADYAAFSRGIVCLEMIK
jgi:SAM-dependent methyltransferase